VTVSTEASIGKARSHVNTIYFKMMSSSLIFTANGYGVFMIGQQKNIIKKAMKKNVKNAM
jgi:hypothetical protein